MGIRLYCNDYSEYTSSYLFWNLFRRDMIKSYLKQNPNLTPNQEFENKLSTIENNGELFSIFLELYEQLVDFINSGIYLLINKSDCLTSFYSVEESHKILKFLNDIQTVDYVDEISQLRDVFDFSVKNNIPVYIE